MEYYWDKLMKKFDVNPDEVESSPLKTKIKRSECPNEPDPQLKTRYLQIIGSIIYGYTHCRLDLAYPVNMLTRIMHSPAEEHFNLLKKLLYYINGTKNWTLNYFRDVTVSYGMDFVFFCNVDAAHADDEETHRSTGGQLNRDRRKISLFHPRSQKLFGGVMLPCKAHSSNNSWTKPDYSKPHLSKCTKTLNR